MITINQYVELMTIIDKVDWPKLERFCLQMAQKEKDLGHTHNETIILETLNNMCFMSRRNLSRKANPLAPGERCPKCSCGVLVLVDDINQQKEPYERLQCSYCWFHGVKHKD